jgi:hypothetical protein
LSAPEFCERANLSKSRLTLLSFTGKFLIMSNYFNIPVHMADFASDLPVRVICPSCQNSVETRVELKHSLGAWIASGLICFVGCFCGCCLVMFLLKNNQARCKAITNTLRNFKELLQIPFQLPFFIEAFKEYKHFCPACGALIGKGRGSASNI